jgi:hypothetical protein
VVAICPAERRVRDNHFERENNADDSPASPAAAAAACCRGRRHGIRRNQGGASIGRQEARGAANPSDDNGVLEATQVARFV